MTINFKIKFGGEYRLQVFDADMVEKTDTGFFDNIITDAFFNTILAAGGGAPNTQFNYCGVGSGSATPMASNTSITQLGARVGQFSANTTNSGMVNTTVIQYRFTVGAIVGTIAEVGLFLGSTGGSTNSRALIKDGVGAPTTITLLATDTLYITWRATCTVPSTDVSGVLSVSGVNYNYVMRPCNITAGLPSSSAQNVHVVCNSRPVSQLLSLGYIGALATQTLGAVTSRPSGTGFFGSIGTTGTYTNGTFTMVATYTLLPAQGNTGSGIGSLMLCDGGVVTGSGYQISFAAVTGGGTIPKDSTKTFTLVVTYTFGR